MLLGTGKKGGRMTIEERIQQAVDWQKAAPRRFVKIEIGSVYGDDAISIWCYDYGLMTGQIVQNGEEIDIPRVLHEREKAQFERLKGKFGEGLK